MIDVVVLNYNDAESTKKYVERICDFSVIDHIVIVDNNSSDDSMNILSQLNNIKISVVQSGKNGGYGYGNNVGVMYAINKFNSEYIAITNPDVIYSNECLEKCAKYLKKLSKKKYAVVAPTMRDINDRFVVSAWNIPTWNEYSCFSLSLLGKIFKLEYVYPNSEDYTDCECIAGSMLLIDSKVFKKIGMYDENIFLYCEETVLGIKLKNYGYKTALINSESFVHAHSVSINKSIASVYKQQKIMWESRLYTLNKYYNINKFKLTIVKILSFLGLLETRVRIRRKKNG